MTKAMKIRLGLALILLSAVITSTTAPEAQAKKFVIGNSSTSSAADAQKSPLGPNTIKTQSGLQYKDIKIGEGESPTKGRTITINFTGWIYPKGEKFDSTIERKIPYKFVVGYGMHNQGLDEGVMSMKVGGKRLLLIPPNLGFGSKGAGAKIPPNATLKYEVELVEVLAPRQR